MVDKRESDASKRQSDASEYESNSESKPSDKPSEKESKSNKVDFGYAVSFSDSGEDENHKRKNAEVSKWIKVFKLK